MSKNVTIKLADIGLAPLEGHKGLIDEVVLRPPLYDEYLSIGEIYSFARSPDGTIITVEDKEAVRAYMGRLLVSPSDPLLLESGGVRLARAVKGAVMGFFQDAVSAAAPSKTLPPSSSGEPTSSPPSTSSE